MRGRGQEPTAAALTAGPYARSQPASWPRRAGEDSKRAREPHGNSHMAERFQAEREAPATSGAVSVRVYLAGKDPAGLASVAIAVSTRETRCTATI